MPAESTTAADARPPLLQVEGLCKTFGRAGPLDRLLHRTVATTAALDDVSLTVAAGDTVGVVGESGSGKSTFARTLVRLIEPDAGRIRFRDEDLLALHGGGLVALRRRVQLIYQD